MNRKLITLSISIVVFFQSSSILAQDITQSMTKAYKAFRDLQPYLSSPVEFQSPNNQGVISKLTSELRDNFHSAKTFSSKYHSEPGFDVSLNLLLDTLNDALRRFNENKKSYAYWRMRHVSQNCVSCHTTYNVTLRFDDSEAALDELTPLQKADFFLATRQIDKAENALKQAVEKRSGSFTGMEIARKFLLLYTRAEISPGKAYETLTKIKPDLDLSQDENEELNSWLVPLNLWSKESTKEKSALTLKSLESLIRSAVKDDLLEDKVDAVSLLRGTSGLHALLREKSLSASDKGAALYLLGFAYSKLHIFFIDQFPEFYLEQCIEEFPGTKDAIRSYKLYKEIVTLDYTGSAGTDVPGDVAAKLMELHDKAYNIPRMEGKV